MDTITMVLRFKYIILIVGFILTGIAIILNAWHNQWSISLDNAIKIIGLGIGVTTAVYAAMNLRHIYESHQEEITNKKKAYSMHLMELWLEPEMTETSSNANLLLKEINETNDTDQAYSLFNEKHDERHSLLSILNYFELLSISIDNNVADEYMLKQFFRGIVVYHYNNMASIIEIRRQKSNNQKIFKDFQNLAEKWS